MVRHCVVGSRFIRHIDFIEKLATTKGKDAQIELLKWATPAQIQAIIDVAHNVVIKKKFCPRGKHRKKLIKYVPQLRQIGRAQPKEVKMFVQKGRGIAAVTALLLPVLDEIARALKKAV